MKREYMLKNKGQIIDAETIQGRLKEAWNKIKGLMSKFPSIKGTVIWHAWQGTRRIKRPEIFRKKYGKRWLIVNQKTGHRFCVLRSNGKALKNSPLNRF